MVFLMMLGEVGATFTAHGFRSAFRDWASEFTIFPREVCEMALAHSIKDKTEAAYRRGDLFAKRKELMDCLGNLRQHQRHPKLINDWDRHVIGGETDG